MKKYRDEIALVVGLPFAYLLGHYLGGIAIIGGFLLGLLFQGIFKQLWK